MKILPKVIFFASLSAGCGGMLGVVDPDSYHPGGSYWRFVRPGTTDETRVADYQACGGTELSGLKPWVTGRIHASLEAQVSCMESRGYHVVDTAASADGSPVVPVRR
jgi:hypothetical protein